MRKLIVFHILTLLAFAMVSCGNNGNAQASTEETLPEGYKAFEFTNFYISVPEEFKTTFVLSLRPCSNWIMAMRFQVLPISMLPS